MGQQTAGEIPAVGYAAQALPEHIVQAMQKDRHMAACFVPYLVILNQRTAVGAGEVLAEAVGAQLLFILSRRKLAGSHPPPPCLLSACADGCSKE